MPPLPFFTFVLLGAFLRKYWSSRDSNTLPTPPHPEAAFNKFRTLLEGDAYLHLSGDNGPGFRQVVLLVQPLLESYQTATAAARQPGTAPDQIAASGTIATSSSSSSDGAGGPVCQTAIACASNAAAKLASSHESTLQLTAAAKAMADASVQQVISAADPELPPPQPAAARAAVSAPQRLAPSPLPVHHPLPAAAATPLQHEQQLPAHLKLPASPPVANTIQPLLPSSYQEPGSVVAGQILTHLMAELEQASSPDRCRSVGLRLLDFAAAAGSDGAMSGGGVTSTQGGALAGNLGIRLGDALRHISACRVVAVDCEHADEIAATAGYTSAALGGTAAPAGAAKGKEGSGKPVSSSSRREGGGRGGKRLAMLQVMAPEVPAGGSSSSKDCSGVGWPARIYLIALPQQQEAAAAVVHQLQPMLTSSSLVKVMHDARQVGS